MAIYRFIGTEALVITDGRTTELNRFGQPIELTDEQARIDEGNKVPLCTDQDFRSRFTDKEIEQYPTAIDQRGAPASFLAKKEALLDEFRQRVAAIYRIPETVFPKVLAPAVEVQQSVETPTVAEEAR